MLLTVSSFTISYIQKIDAEVDNDIEWIASICSKSLNLEILQFIYELSVQLWHSLMLVCYVWVTEV